MIKISAALFLLSISIFPKQRLAAQQAKADIFRIAFYNLENLFDPSDDPNKNDEEFTPEGMRNWSEYRYREKSNHMAKAILSIGNWQPPAILGVAEIENRKVLEDLIHSDVLRKFNFAIIHYESPDRRGIDVGMLYRTNLFTPLYSHNFPVKMPDDPDFATRDMLYCKGVLQNGDTIHIMYCHWPSRYGGQAATIPKRIQAALTVRGIKDSILAAEPEANIIIEGDLNDEWTNQSIADYLKAGQQTDFKNNGLVDLMSLLPVNEGSHRYHGVWAYLDHIIVTSDLLDGKGPDIIGQSAHVVRHSFLLEKDSKYPGQMPFRTFIGMKYHGGFSDHLPVYVDLVDYRKKK